VYKCLNVYKNTGIGNVNSNELINLVLSKKHHYNPNKGGFNAYFATITKNYMIQLYKKDEERIKLVMTREDKLNQLLND
jgi:DNA-directed RNA polymerase specialized sigma24 family protein